MLVKKQKTVHMYSSNFFSLVCTLSKYLTVLVLLLVSATLSQAKSLEVASGWARPPYVIPESHTGFELDIVKQVLANMGLEAHFIYAPYDRTIGMLKQNKVDMVLTVNANSGIETRLLSDPFVVYQNVALSLKENKINLNTIADLRHRSVVAFQGASLLLGSEFQKNMAQNHLYLEMGDTRRKMELLLHGEVDAIIIDINIFTEIARTTTGHDQLNIITIHPLFDVSPFRAGFNDFQLKQGFNQALRKFVASDEYQTLKRQYKIQDAIPVKTTQ